MMRLRHISFLLLTALLTPSVVAMTPALPNLETNVSEKLVRCKLYQRSGKSFMMTLDFAAISASPQSPIAGDSVPRTFVRVLTDTSDRFKGKYEAGFEVSTGDYNFINGAVTFDPSIGVRDYFSFLLNQDGYNRFNLESGATRSQGSIIVTLTSHSSGSKIVASGFCDISGLKETK